MFDTNANNWAIDTFKSVDLKDKRRNNRLIKLATELAEGAGKSVVKACKDTASIEGAYRFIENDSIDPKAIAQAGFESTALKCEKLKLVLALEDTTGLSFKHDMCKELGDFSASRNEACKARSLYEHSILALNAETETVVGLAHQQSYIRNRLPKELKNSGSKRARQPRESKESYRWEESSTVLDETFTRTDNIIHVCDREADAYEYIDQQIENDRRFIVRAQYNRKLVLPDGNTAKLKDLMDTPAVLEQDVKIIQKGKGKGNKKNRPAKVVKVGISYHQVVMSKTHDADASVKDKRTLNLVVCREINPADEGSQLCWLLYTNEAINSIKDAQQIIRFYELRWRIEEFHKTWKTDGTQVEKLRLQTRANTERLATILAFVAIRLMQLKELAENKEEAKQQSCEEVFSPLEWKMLWKETQNTDLPDTPPSLYWAYYALAKLGGWYDSKRTGCVGQVAIWDGWKELMLMIKGYRLMQNLAL